MSFNLDYGLGALTRQEISVSANVKLKNVSFEWSLSFQSDSGCETPSALVLRVRREEMPPTRRIWTPTSRSFLTTPSAQVWFG